jgi:hypothetical protein
MPTRSTSDVNEEFPFLMTKMLAYYDRRTYNSMDEMMGVSK